MNKGYTLSAPDGIEKAIAGILKKCLNDELCEAALVPMKSGNGCNFVLIEDPKLLDRAEILPPVMPVQGGKTLLSLTRHGKSRKTAVVMRPCEIRAAVELSKLHQTDLDNILVISMDCDGVMPLPDYRENDGSKTDVRPLCSICENFSLNGNGENQGVDIHIASIGVKSGSVMVIPVSEQGKETVQSLGMDGKEDTGSWSSEVDKIRKDRTEARKKVFAELSKEAGGLDGLMNAFSTCIECYNCRSMCPICYCRLCFIDKGTTADSAENFILRAESKGALRFLPEPLLFHIGRMSHMSLSCVSCGMCEDVCPMDIPVGRIFSMVSEKTRALFDYTAGNVQDEFPYMRFELEELTDKEDR